MIHIVSCQPFNIDLNNKMEEADRRINKEETNEMVRKSYDREEEKDEKKAMHRQKLCTYGCIQRRRESLLMISPSS